MSEPEIHLPLRTQHCNVLIRDCEWKLKTFVERDAYVYYDYAASFARPHRDQISEFHIDAINQVMLARSSRKAWAQFINKPLPDLSLIPESLDLIDASDNQVQQALVSLRRLVELKGQPIPVRLTTIRILDILLWSDVAIHGPKPHPNWRRWYMEEVTGERVVGTKPLHIDPP
jgi:hypothetical protein